MFYECDVGHNLENGDTNRTCGADGYWTGIQPACNGISFLLVKLLFMLNIPDNVDDTNLLLTI